jgi:hypothetical protein
MRELARALREALPLAWGVLSCLTLTAVAAPFLVPAGKLHAAAAALRVPHEQRCPLCGMTTAFVHIARGEPLPAWRANKLAIPLFLVLAADSLAFVCILAVRVRRRSETPL